MKLNRIPHIYHNTIFAKKLFEIIYKKHLKVREAFYELSLFNDLENSKGHLLDMLGSNFKVLRNGLIDSEYRRILKFEISLLQFLGSPEEIQRILSEYFKLNKEEFRIIELSGKILISIPEKLDKADIFKVVKKIKAAGVGLEIKFGIYVEDYLISELHEMTLEEIEKITLAREEYYIEMYSLNEIENMTLEELEKLKISRR